MMKKLSKLLVFLLTLVLIGSSPGISPIQAAAENAANETQKEKELETVSKTADTIVLKAGKTTNTQEKSPMTSKTPPGNGLRRNNMTHKKKPFLLPD